MWWKPRHRGRRVFRRGWMLAVTRQVSKLGGARRRNSAFPRAICVYFLGSVCFCWSRRNLLFSNAYFVARTFSLLPRTIFIVLFLWACLKTTLRTTHTLLAWHRCRSVWRLSPMALRFDHISLPQVAMLISYTDNNHRVHRKTGRSPDARLALSF